jgi:hypothetical protein
MSSLDLALQRALSVRLNLQISLSQLAIVEEWMDIHLDRWLEHNPMPPDMPDGKASTYRAMLGTDLRRLWWGAWGDPRGFVPKMADYFKLCNIARSDAALLDQIGEQLEPDEVGSWIAVWGGKVVTGWHFWDARPWAKVDAMFGTHEAKYQLRKLVDTLGLERIERFSQSIGDTAFSEVELAMPGADVASQVSELAAAVTALTGAPLEPSLIERFRAAKVAGFGLSVRIRGGAIARVGAIAPAIALADVDVLAADAKVGVEAKFGRLVNALASGVARVEYARAGDRAGLDVYIEPSTTPLRDDAGSPAPPPPSTQANN